MNTSQFGQYSVPNPMRTKKPGFRINLQEDNVSRRTEQIFIFERLSLLYQQVNYCTYFAVQEIW